MMIINFAFCRPSVSKGILLGRHRDHTMLTIRLGFCLITVFGSRTNDLIREALGGLAEDPEWMVKNSSSVRRFKREIIGKALEEAEQSRKDSIKHYQDAYYASEEKLTKLTAENKRMRQALETIRSVGLKD